MEKEMEKELDKILMEAHIETQREIRNEKTKINNEDFAIIDVEATPFAILIEKKKHEVWLIMGNEKIKKYETKTAAEQAARHYDWDMLGPVMMTIARHTALDVHTEYQSKKQNYNNLNKN